jgi:ABC-type tungstate transport system substrate-binding protein
MPALPLGSAGTYVAAAYIVFLVVLAIYVAIMSHKLSRADRRVAELDRVLREREQ